MNVRCVIDMYTTRVEAGTRIERVQVGVCVQVVVSNGSRARVLVKHGCSIKLEDEWWDEAW